MIISITMTGDQELVARFRGLPATLRKKVVDAVTKATLNLQAYIVGQKLTGQVLNVRTGALRRSIQVSLPTDDAQPIVGRVYSSGDVKYAAIHEFGGNINHPGGTAYLPKGGGLASWISNAAAMDFPFPLPRTRPHVIPMPERSFMRSALADKRSEIETLLRAAIGEALEAPG